jgi:hypothetical protein
MAKLWKWSRVRAIAGEEEDVHWLKGPEHGWLVLTFAGSGVGRRETVWFRPTWAPVWHSSSDPWYLHCLKTPRPQPALATVLLTLRRLLVESITHMYPRISKSLDP